MITMSGLLQSIKEIHEQPFISELRMNAKTKLALYDWGYSADADRVISAANIYGVANLFGTAIVDDELVPDHTIIPVWSDGTVGKWPV